VPGKKTKGKAIGGVVVVVVVLPFLKTSFSFLKQTAYISESQFSIKEDSKIKHPL